MHYRKLGKTNWPVSEIGLGTWQVGGGWSGPFDHAAADRILQEAVDRGVNFIDTADVYGDGESEKAVGRLVRSRSEELYVATKCGRRLPRQATDLYTPDVLRGYVEDSLRNMGLERIDLVQLHCPPTEVYYRPEIFETFDRLIEEGKIRRFGVSVEKVEEALKAIEYPVVSTVQIIFNMFRLRPAELFFREAQRRDIGIIARVPLASGLLTGKFTRQTTFAHDDHRHFNRDGSAFDRGETFSGVEYQRGIDAVKELKKLFPNANLPQVALKWVLMFEAVSTVIPGASKVEQVLSNIQSGELPALTPEQMEAVAAVYDRYVRSEVHQRW